MAGKQIDIWLHNVTPPPGGDLLHHSPSLNCCKCYNYWSLVFFNDLKGITTRNMCHGLVKLVFILLQPVQKRELCWAATKMSQGNGCFSRQDGSLVSPLSSRVAPCSPPGVSCGGRGGGWVVYSLGEKLRRVRAVAMEGWVTSIIPSLAAHVGASEQHSWCLRFETVEIVDRVQLYSAFVLPR